MTRSEGWNGTVSLRSFTGCEGAQPDEHDQSNDRTPATRIIHSGDSIVTFNDRQW